MIAVVGYENHAGNLENDELAHVPLNHH
jgi:hypothetical protein